MNAPLSPSLTRRRFVKASLAASGLAFAEPWGGFLTSGAPGSSRLAANDLPKGNSPKPVPLPHFPDRLHAFIWRNWTLVPLARLAAVVGAKPADILRLGQSMGLPAPGRITRDQWRRSYITILKRNWHLLPYEQLLTLLDWTADQLAYTLREDDFLFIKLGSHKPACEPLAYAPPDAQTRHRAAVIARVLHEEFPQGLPPAQDPLFGFVHRLSAGSPPSRHASRVSRFTPRFCYSYFALYGDPLLEPDIDPYPDGYLARLAASGVDGVWLQAVLYKLAAFPWQPGLSAGFEERLKNLRKLVARAGKHGIGIWLYLNEPRAMPLSFFEQQPDLKGAAEDDHAALCTSHPEVQRYLTASLASICRAVPALAGFFTITASENFTHCWSHGGGANCACCAKRQPAEVIAEVNRLLFDGIRQGSSIVPRLSEVESHARSSGASSIVQPASDPQARRGRHPALIAWDWGWNNAWAEDIIARLPQGVALMSVSEWSLPIERGGVTSSVGEYSISAVGPGPRAEKHWELARRRGLKTLAKIQAGNTWELSAVPYIPAVENVARHAVKLRSAHVDGLMLGWTLGGCPSPNLEVVGEVGADDTLTPQAAMERVAARRFGKKLAPLVVTAWGEFSTAFREFPFHVGVVYSGPQQTGPANPLWTEPTGYRASMVGFPYDDLDSWRAIYPAETFIAQCDKAATGFETATLKLKISALEKDLSEAELKSMEEELTVAEATAIHLRSTVNQARFVLARRALGAAKSRDETQVQLEVQAKVLRDEICLARRLFELQSRDSRLGFEASNQYFYVPIDLVEKVINCRDLLDRWLPSQFRSRKL